MLMLTETSLDDNFMDAKLGLVNYSVFRRDRDYKETDKTRNGGVLIAVKTTLKAEPIKPKQAKSEELWVSVACSGIHKIFGCVYIPPASKTEIYQVHCDNVEHIFENLSKAGLFIGGDYNLPKLKWFNDSMGFLTLGESTVASPIIELFSYFIILLFQLNSIPNINNITLDPIFSNNDCDIVCCACDILILCDRHHPALEITVYCDKLVNILEYENFVLDFKNVDYELLNDYLLSIYWDDLFCGDINLDAVAFYEILNKIIETVVPKSY